MFSGVKLRILVDTNVLIYREDPKEVGPEVQELMSLLNELGCTQVIHPASISELEKDTDENRRAIVISKLAAYEQLRSPPDPSIDQSYQELVGPVKSINDTIDKSYTRYKIC